MPTAVPTIPPSLIGASKHAGLAELFLQPGGRAEHAAEIADVLAEHDDVGIALHHHAMGVVDRLDHVDGRSSSQRLILGSCPRYSRASASAWSRCSARCQGSLA